jgi:hypothetical protein
LTRSNGSGATTDFIFGFGTPTSYGSFHTGASCHPGACPDMNFNSLTIEVPGEQAVWPDENLE